MRSAYFLFLFCVLLLLYSTVQVASAEGGYTYTAQWGNGGLGYGRFSDPEGVAVDSTGNIFVADRLSNRILKFTSTGTFITQWGSEGSGNGQFDNPGSIAVDSAGNVYVTDTWNHRVQKFNSTGAFITTWGSEGSGDGQLEHKKVV